MGSDVDAEVLEEELKIEAAVPAQDFQSRGPNQLHPPAEGPWRKEPIDTDPNESQFSHKLAAARCLSQVQEKNFSDRSIFLFPGRYNLSLSTSAANDYFLIPENSNKKKDELYCHS